MCFWQYVTSRRSLYEVCSQTDCNNAITRNIVLCQKSLFNKISRPDLPRLGHIKSFSPATTQWTWRSRTWAWCGPLATVSWGGAGQAKGRGWGQVEVQGVGVDLLLEVWDVLVAADQGKDDLVGVYRVHFRVIGNFFLLYLPEKSLIKWSRVEHCCRIQMGLAIFAK